ncbi:MAG TPA: dephospho-CoA kinase [Cyclobacteriaceae bacterium]|nr:dephospho-CoA kinase [Cyclobacteriaceae bacterium]
MAKSEILLKVGVTGGIGAGKSIVCGIFSTLGVPVYNADQHAKFLMENDPAIISQIRKNFSDESYANGRLNNRFLSAIVFNNKDNLAHLNQIVHPRVRVDFGEWLELHKGRRYIIKEAALLFESKSFKELDKTILVVSPLETRIRRVILRDQHRNRQEIEKIIENQMPDNEKTQLADFVIQNDDSHMIIPQVLKINEEILSQ